MGLDSTWRKSCPDQLNCIEVRKACNDLSCVELRNGEGAVMIVTDDEWTEFITGAKAGKFDL